MKIDDEEEEEPPPLSVLARASKSPSAPLSHPLSLPPNRFVGTSASSVTVVVVGATKDGRRRMTPSFYSSFLPERQVR